LPITEVVHRALAASDVPWAIVTNGKKLRLLSRASSHKPLCFFDANLDFILDQRNKTEAQRSFRFLLALFSGTSFVDYDDHGRSLLDRVADGSDRHGKEIGQELKNNVFSALQELGEGFLAYMRANPKATDRWRDSKAPNQSRDKFLTSDTLLEDIYHESLSLMYRLLFLFYAESRELLPLDNDTYRESYSLESIRDEVRSVQDDPDTKRFFAAGNTTLWERLAELFKLLDTGWGTVIPPYNGGLFDPEKHEFLERFAVGDLYLGRAIDLLSRTKPRAGQSKGEGRKKVTYRDLDVRHLGSIYEGILEYTAHIADQEYVVLSQGSGPAVTAEYVALAELDQEQRAQFAVWREAVEENPENPKLPRGCKIEDRVEKGQYYLVFGGRESKRKSSGSYYTPDYIVQYIVEDTLGPLVRGECRPQPQPPTAELKAIGWKSDALKTGALSSDEILALKVLDPAMGSGHFLVAATEYLARAYREARLLEGAISDESRADQEFIRYKRIIAERCIYGVDVNLMAVELAKLSMWLFTMDPGRPLSFLDHHLKCGNSIVGAWIDDLGNLPQATSSATRAPRDGRQANLFARHLYSALPVMISDIFKITTKETTTTQDIEDKKTLDHIVDTLKTPFRKIADYWTASAFGEDASDYLSLLVNPDSALATQSKTARLLRFFHWEIEFPEVFFALDGQPHRDSGFDVCIGNPPYRREKDAKELFDTLRAAPISREAYKGRMDLWYFFGHLSIRLLKQGGAHSFITSVYWTQADGASRLREAMRASGLLDSVVDFGKFQIFENASGQYTVYRYFKSPSSRSRKPTLWSINDPLPTLDELVACLQSKDLSACFSAQVKNSLFDAQGSVPLSVHADDSYDTDKWKSIEQSGIDVGEGVTPGPESLSQASAERAAEARGINLHRHMQSHGLSYGDGVFICNKRTFQGVRLTPAEKQIIVPFLEMHCFAPYQEVDPSASEKVLIYSSQETLPDPSLAPSVLAHLTKFKFVMEQRRETQQGRRPWFQLHWPRQAGFVYGLKVIVPRMVRLPYACFGTRDCAVGEAVLCMPAKTQEEVHFWVAYINSWAIQKYLVSKAKRRGIGVDISVKLFNSVPLPENVLRFAGGLRSRRPTPEAKDKAFLDFMDAAGDLCQNHTLTEDAFIAFRDGTKGLPAQVDRRVKLIDETVSRWLSA
jgi:hypothetical protein